MPKKNKRIEITPNDLRVITKGLDDMVVYVTVQEQGENESGFENFDSHAAIAKLEKANSVIDKINRRYLRQVSNA